MELFRLNKSYGVFLCTFSMHIRKQLFGAFKVILELISMHILGSMHIDNRLFFDYFFQGGAKIRRHLEGALILFNFQYVTKGIFIHV